MAQRKKVLVINNDPESGGLIGRALEPYGFELTAASDARSGFEAAKDQIPDLIFINLLLPEINGLKVSKAIHSVEALKAVPIIMILAQTGDIDPRYTAAIGIVDVLVEPFSSGEIVAKARAALGEDALVPGAEDGTNIPFGDEGIEPIIVIDEDEENADEVLVAAEADPEMPHAIQADEHHLTEAAAVAEERDTERSEMAHRFKRGEDPAGERDLFSTFDPSGDETMSYRDEPESNISDTSNLPADDYDPATGEMSVSPIRRGLMIAASIAAGIALGIGGYLFFTAGNKQQPLQTQVTKVLPPPAASTPVAPATPGEKQGKITEIPVKQEPDDQGTTKQQQAKIHEPAASEEKVARKAPEAQTQPAKKAASKPIPADGPYYVQAGLFEHKDNAAALAAKIRKTGFEASVKNVDGADKKTLYRVVAGTYTSHTKAVEMSESLGRKGIKTIVRRK